MKQKKTSNMNPVKTIVISVGAIIATVAFLLTVEFARVKGNQMGILETWSDGVVDKVYQPGKHMLIPGFSKDMIVYDMNLQSYTLQNYNVQASDNQNVSITATIRWKRDPKLLKEHHKMVRDNPEKRLIEPTMFRIIKDNVTMKRAIDGYSGVGLVALQNDIEKAIRADAEL